MIEKIMMELKKSGIDVYAPGTHKGECKSEYVVVKLNSQHGFNKSSGRRIVDILLYCPMGRYTKVESFAKKVKESMKRIGVRATGNETPIITENSKRAYSTSVQYEILKRL